MERSKPHINPKVLTWARTRLNATPEAIAKSIGTKEEKYLTWENGEERPSHKQLGKLAHQLQLPITAFYLRAIPDQRNVRLDMRRLPGYTAKEDSFQFSKQVNECTRRRKMTLELIERMEMDFPKFSYCSTINDSPEEMADHFRKYLNVTIDEQLKNRGMFEALKNWRQILEKNGVLVFQLERVDIDEARGFSLYYDLLPIVTINSNDSPAGRIFTLFHEVAHIVLGESMIHNHMDLDSSNKTEDWCNRFSAHFLVPVDDLIEVCSGMGDIDSEEKLDKLIKRYWVSGSALLRRLRSHGLISKSSYLNLVKIYDSYRQSKSASHGNYYNNMTARMGTLLPDLAFDSYYSNVISIRDLSTILNMKVSNLKEFEKRIKGHHFAFGE